MIERNEEVAVFYEKVNIQSEAMILLACLCPVIICLE